MRKVHRLVSDRDGSELTSNIITPSSWRAGKQLAEKVLESQAKESKRDYSPVPSPDSSYRSYHDSLESDQHSSHNLSRSVSDIGSQHHQSLPSDDESIPPPGRTSSSEYPSAYAASEASLHNSSHGSSHSSSHLRGHPRAAQLSSDINRLLEELKDSPPDKTKRDQGEEKAEQAMPRLGGKRFTPSDPANKKPKYNFGKKQMFTSLPMIRCG